MFTKEQYIALFAAMRDAHIWKDSPEVDACVTSTLHQVINVLLDDETAARWMKMFNVNE